MDLNGTRSALRSETPRVVVEAPAGCGKTYEAVACAIDLAATLRDEQEVLLLAHTNAAVSEFRRRARRARARVHATTLDAFALNLVTPYAAALGLPTPLVPGNGAGQTSFHRLAPKALELITRAPSIGAAIRRHYPVVLLDEHQDTSQAQHDLAMELGRWGRVRIFGDPMQGIYDFGGETLVDWELVAEAADLRATLDRPQRWTEVSELGEWSLIAREALRTGVRLPLETAPECVCVIPVSDLDDVPNPKSDRVLAPIIPVLRRQLRELDGSVVVLGRYNAHVRGLYSAVRGSLIVQEGVDFDGAYTALAVVDTALGDPRQLAQAAVDLLASTCRGFNAKVQQQLSASLLSDRLDRGKRRQIAPLLDALEPLYATPDFPTWCRAISATHPSGCTLISRPVFGCSANFGRTKLRHRGRHSMPPSGTDETPAPFHGAVLAPFTRPRA